MSAIATFFLAVVGGITGVAAGGLVWERSQKSRLNRLGRRVGNLERYAEREARHREQRERAHGGH